MTQHEDIVRLHHMLDNAQEAVSMIAGKDRSEYNRIGCLSWLWSD